MRKLSLKNIIILGLSLVLVVGYVARVAYINVNDSVSVVRVNVGEPVTQYNKEYTVNSYSLFTREEFEKEYGVTVSEEMYDPLREIKILVVDLNEKLVPYQSSKRFKSDMGNILAQTTTYAQGVSYSLYTEINSESITLKEVGDNANHKLVYVFNKDLFSDDQWMRFESDTIKISLNDAENTKKEIILQ